MNKIERSEENRSYCYIRTESRLSKEWLESFGKVADRGKAEASSTLYPCGSQYGYSKYEIYTGYKYFIVYCHDDRVCSYDTPILEMILKALNERPDLTDLSNLSDRPSYCVKVGEL